MNKENFVKMAVAAPLKQLLTYKNPSGLVLKRGQSVHAPLGRQKVRALVWEITSETPENLKLKSVETLNEDRPCLHEPFLDWLKWLSDYYIYPLGQVAELAFPPLGPATNRRQKSRKKSLTPSQDFSQAPPLTEEQKKCAQNLESYKEFSVHLLFGVTGSGKTEVYFQKIKETLLEGKSILFLVPEISLTPQMIQRLSQRFPDEVAVIHSQLTPREKTDQWWLAFNQKRKIVLGARSALFCPLSNLGLIIVDEEHEPSFKQEEKLRYQARDAAIMLAQKHNCPIVLGSATPSLETWQNIQLGKYHLHKLTRPFFQKSAPSFKVISLIKENPLENKKVDLPFWLSYTLYEKIQNRLNQKEQTALFLNRRGFAPLVQCNDCGFSSECPNCSINLTLHRNQHLICHYCQYSTPLKSSCPKCKSENISPLGLGTEQVEEGLKQLFPQARLMRADRDELQNRTDLENMIHSMENQEVDILIGTQMIAKGLDFPSVTLVGLLLADLSFYIPDFRATERSFQLLVQMGGRSGRSHQPGEAILQTRNLEQDSLKFALQKDYEGFAKKELSLRKELLYPPFGKMALFRFSSLNQSKAQKVAEFFHKRALALQQTMKDPQFQILGPSPAPLFKLQNRFRYHLLIKMPRSKNLSRLAETLLDVKNPIPQTKIQVDIDPMQML